MNIPEFIEYAKQNWLNKPSKTTPITAERLNHIEEGIATNNKLLKELIEATTQLNSDMSKSKNVVKISSLDSITETGCYNGQAFNTSGWQIIFAIVQADKAACAFAIDINYSNLYIGYKPKNGSWKTQKIG